MKRARVISGQSNLMTIMLTCCLCLPSSFIILPEGLLFDPFCFDSKTVSVKPGGAVVVPQQLLDTSCVMALEITEKTVARSLLSFQAV